MNFSRDNKTEPSSKGQDLWLTGKDGTSHFLRCFQAVKSSAYVVYLHGIEGHSLWFQDTALFLAQNGVTTLALDRRGSGLSKEARGDLNNWQQLLNDTVEVLRFAHEQAGNLPVFLMANCWGAKLAALLAQQKRPESRLISGLIFSSPALELKVDLPLKEKLKVVWRFFCGSKLPLRIPLEVEDFTDNPQYLAFIAGDRLRLTEATARFFVNTFLLTILSKRSAANIYLPTLVVQAGTDSIVEADGVKKWFDKISAADKTFHVFPGALHSLDFDRDPHDYRQMLLSWISERCALKQAKTAGSALRAEKASP